MRDGHGLDEVLLEPRLDRRLDLLDAAHDAFDLAPGRARQQRDQRPGAGGVAGGSDAVEVAVRDEAEDHRVERVDLAAERAGQADLVDGVASELVHQQPHPGVQGGLGQLDRADVVLGDDDARTAVGRLVQDVAERPAVGDDPRRPRRDRAVDDAVGGDDAGEVQLGDDLDDPRAADAGDAGAGRLERVGEVRARPTRRRRR